MILQVSHLTEAFASRGRVKGGYLFDLMKFYTPPENETNSCPKEWTCLKRKCHFPTINFHWDVCFGGRYLKLIVVSVSVGISTDSLPFWKMIPEKKKQKRRLVCSTSSYLHVFVSEKLLATLFDVWKFHFFGPRNIPSKSLVMRNSLLLSRVTGVATPTHALGNPKKNLPLLRRKFGQSEPRSQEIRKRSSWEKAKASMPWSCSSRGDVWSS